MGQFSMTDKDVPFGTAGGFGSEVTGGFGGTVGGNGITDKFRQRHGRGSDGNRKPAVTAEGILKRLEAMKTERAKWEPMVLIIILFLWELL